MCESKQQICYSKKITNDAGTPSLSISYLLTHFLHRKTSTIQSGLFSTSSSIDHRQFSLSSDQSRRKDHLHEILPRQSLQQRGSQVISKQSSLTSIDLFSAEPLQPSQSIDWHSSFIIFWLCQSWLSPHGIIINHHFCLDYSPTSMINLFFCQSVWFDQKKKERKKRRTMLPYWFT